MESKPLNWGQESVELLEGTDENVVVSNLCLISKVLAPKNLKKQGIMNIIKGAWKAGAKLEISPWSDNVFIFQFEDLGDRRRLLFEALWSIIGNLLVLQPLQAGRSTLEMEFQWCPF
ncbi:hypothetical protein ACSBR2_038862 [Camellia fascicularis]